MVIIMSEEAARPAQRMVLEKSGFTHCRDVRNTFVFNSNTDQQPGRFETWD